MHLIKDENGNIIEHAHNGVQKQAGHGNDNHSHGGTNVCPSPTIEQMVAVLDYMLKHNEHHAAELDTVSQKLSSLEENQAAELIHKAVDEFQKGNMYLSLALSTVRDGSRGAGL